MDCAVGTQKENRAVVTGRTANNSSCGSSTDWGSAIASSTELRIPSSSHSAMAPRQKAAEPVSPKGIYVMAHFGQCFPTLPSRFFIKGVWKLLHSDHGTGPFEDGDEEQPLCPILPSPPSHLSLLLSYLDCHWGRRAGKESGCWKLY